MLFWKKNRIKNVFYFSRPRFSGPGSDKRDRRPNPLLKRLAKDVKSGEETGVKSIAKKRWGKAKVLVKGAVKVQMATAFVAAFRTMELSKDLL